MEIVREKKPSKKSNKNFVNLGWLKQLLIFVAGLTWNSILSPILSPILSFLQIPLFSYFEYANARVTNSSGEVIDISIFTVSNLIFMAIMLFGIISVIVSIYALHYAKLKLAEDSKLEKIKANFESILSDVDFIEGIQLYKFTKSTINKKPSSHELIIVKHLASCCGMEANLNGIQQELFRLPFRLYKKIDDWFKHYNFFIKDRCYFGHGITKDVWVAEGRKICNEIEQKVLHGDSDESDCCLYRLYRIIRELIDGSSLDLYFGDEHKELEIELVTAKRTGILASVFTNDMQIYNNFSSKFKQDRWYCSFKAAIDGLDYEKGACIILVTIVGDHFDKDARKEQINFRISEAFAKYFDIDQNIA